MEVLSIGININPNITEDRNPIVMANIALANINNCIIS